MICWIRIRVLTGMRTLQALHKQIIQPSVDISCSRLYGTLTKWVIKQNKNTMNKTMKNIVNALFAVVFILLGTQLSYGQYAYFAESGKIEYEKRVNMFAKIKGRITEDDVFMKKLYEDYRKNQPQFVTMKTSLSFNKNQSLYQITEEPKTASNWFSNEPWIMVKNTILTNFESEDVVAVKKIFGEDFVLKDKQREILWKYTNEVREIAGFECKRAN